MCCVVVSSARAVYTVLRACPARARLQADLAGPVVLCRVGVCCGVRLWVERGAMAGRACPLVDSFVVLVQPKLGYAEE